MKFADIMTSNPILLSPEQTIKEVARIFLENRIDGAPVVNQQGEIIGLFTKSHIIKVVAENLDSSAPVATLMTAENIVTVSPESKVEDFYRSIPEAVSDRENPFAVWTGRFDEQNLLEVGRLPVVVGKKVVGMCTRSDLSKVYRDLVTSVSSEFETIINSVHNPIISVDRQGLINIFNRPAERLLGRTWEAVHGKSIKAIFPSSKLQETLKTGKVEYSQQVTLNGKKFISNRTPIIKDGKIIGAVSVLQDITEIEEISRELQNTSQLNAELDAIIESSFDGLFVTDGEGVVLRLNRAFERITGLRREELIGRKMSDLTREGYFSESVSLLVLERREPVTITQQNKNGKLTLVTGNPIYNEQGQIFRIVTNVRDITELNELKHKLDQVQGLSEHYASQLRHLKMKYADTHKMIISSVKMENLIQLALRLARVDSTILIQGESGVGKELIAETIHVNSPRRQKAFIKVNCGAIPENLLESELFGYEEGAFTGAKKEGKLGIFELADGGTLFLDEIGELPLSLQVKLLRVLQDREITRVGGIKPLPVDVRIIAGTNRDLSEMVMSRTFREDLFYRLNVVPLMVPPLRERPEEIPAMVAHFVSKYNQRYRLNKQVTPEVINLLMEYHWPGNVRELENLIERLVVITPGDTITSGDLPPHIGGRSVRLTPEVAVSDVVPLRYAIENLEKQLLEKAFAKFGTTRKIAKELGVNQSTVVRKAAKYGISHRSNTMRA